MNIARFKVIVCGAFFLMLSLSVIAAQEDNVITIVTEEVPVLQIVENGEVVGGITVEVVAEIFKQAKLPYKFKVLPWQRAYQQTLKEPNTFIMSMARNAEREDSFIWVAKISTLQANITTLKSRDDISITTPQDFLRYMISVSRGDFGETYLKSLGMKEGENLYLTPKYENLWKMLYSGRIDAVFTNDITAKPEIISAGLSPELTHITYIIKELKTDLYLAANKQTDPALLHKLETSYNELKASGKLDNIINGLQPKPKMLAPAK